MAIFRICMQVLPLSADFGDFISFQRALIHDYTLVPTIWFQNWVQFSDSYQEELYQVSALEQGAFGGVCDEKQFDVNRKSKFSFECCKTSDAIYSGCGGSVLFILLFFSMMQKYTMGVSIIVMDCLCFIEEAVILFPDPPPCGYLCREPSMSV